MCRSLRLVVFTWGVVLVPRVVLAQGFVDHTKLAPLAEPATNGMGGGVAFADYDGDGWLDVFVAHGNRGVFLYRNGGPPDFDFEDVSSDIDAPSSSESVSGVATADVDRDGDPDLLVADSSSLLLLENVGGRFEDVTERALPRLPWYHVSVTAADVDGDGFVDLYAPAYLLYVDWPRHECAPSVLLRNRGDGTFEDVSASSGTDDRGCSLAALFSDSDRDGDVDLFVANDFGTFSGANRLYRNDGLDAQGAILFTDVSEPSGAAPRLYGMGLATADIDGNGYPDYFSTSIGRSVLVLGEPDAPFVDGTELYGVASTLGYSGWRATWGCAFLDAENDGLFDLAVASGFLPAAVEIKNGAEQPSLFFEDLDLDPVARDRGIDLGVAPTDSSRGLAVGDFDRDGDEDVLTAAVEAEAHLYRNEMEDVGPALSVSLRGTVSNTDALGARVDLECADVSRGREVTIGGSYASAHALGVTLALAGCDEGGTLVVHWPSGLVEERDVDGTSEEIQLTEPLWIDVDPKAIPADGASTATVTISPRDEEGVPLGPGHDLVVTTTEGSVGDVSDLGDGTYEAVVTAPVAVGEAALGILLSGELLPAHPRIRFFPAGGDQTTVYASPTTFIADVTYVRLTVFPRDSSGVPDGAGHSVTFDLVGATPSGSVSDLGDGRYGLDVVGDGGGPIEATARVDGSPRGETIVVPEIDRIDPQGSVLRLIPGWVDEDALESTEVGVFVSPRDGMGNLVPRANRLPYRILGTEGELLPSSQSSRSGSMTFYFSATELLDAAPITVEADGVALARELELSTYDEESELVGVIDPAQSWMSPFHGTAYADGQDYAWIQTQLRDAEGDAILLSEGFTYSSAPMTVVETYVYGYGLEGKARLRAGLAPGRAVVRLVVDDTPTGVETWVDLLPSLPRDLSSDRIRTCVTLELEAEQVEVRVSALDEQGFLEGSNYPVALFIDGASVPIDYQEPGAFLTTFPLPEVGVLASVETALAGTDRGSELVVEVLDGAGLVALNPDRPSCVEVEPGFVWPGDDDAGPSGDDGPDEEDAGPTTAPPFRGTARGGGCDCGVAGAGRGPRRFEAGLELFLAAASVTLGARRRRRV